MKSQLRLKVLLPLVGVALLGLGVSKFALGGEQIEQTPAIVHTAAKAEPAAKTPAAEPKTQLERSLAKHRVVVVVLYAPDASVDSLVTREGRAGARSARAGFLAVNVLDEDSAKAVAGNTPVRVTPTVFVFTRGQQIAAQLSGFSDRQTIAQAAENAAA
jgi:hypothetical protein